MTRSTQMIFSLSLSSTKSEIKIFKKSEYFLLMINDVL